MSSNTDLVLKNFRYRIESITPTNTTPSKNYKWFDPLRLDSDESSGMTRGFYVYWSGSKPEETTDLADRIAEHDFIIEVAYSTDFELEMLQTIILNDRHDLIKNLRDDRLWTGYDANHTSTDIGLYSRELISDEINKRNNVTWFLTQKYKCVIKEAE